MSEDIEFFAEKAHDIWAMWMNHFLAKYQASELPDGDYHVCIPRADYKRWRRQITLSYKRLSEKEKESDRKVAKEVFIDE